MKKSFFSKHYLTNIKQLLIHILFWILYTSFAAFHAKYSDAFNSTNSFIAVFAIDFITIYSLFFIIIQKNIVKKGKEKYFFLLIFLILIINFSLHFILQNYVFRTPTKNFENDLIQIFYSIQHSFIFIIIATGMMLYRHNIKISERIKNLETQKIKSELEHLKLQMNPHFLFNTLNNIYIQIRVNPEGASKTLLKLSDLLRYQIYECSDSGKVFLKLEIEYIKNYLELQKVRFSNLKLNFEQTGNIKGLMIHPFIFIPFVENAVKHGISGGDNNNFINIKFKTIKNNLEFIIENSKNNTNLQQKNSDKTKGNGLKNIKTRLKELYPNNYNLEIKERENFYYVKLEINLEK